MKILITGASGFIGSALVKKLQEEGHCVFTLVRKKGFCSNEIFWNPLEEKIEISKLLGFDAVVHLAGENIVGRWTDEKKKKIRESRILGTQFLSKTLASLEKPPKVFLCASAIGYYGNRGEESLTEESQPGKGFLASVCQEWEKSSEPAQEKGIRVVHYRMGMVLSSQGGALPKMLKLFKGGLGGKLSDGQQWMSWISLVDLIEGILFCIQHPSISGAMNAVAPNPVRNKEFTKILGEILHRPRFFSVPRFLLKLIMGEMAEEVLLTSTKVSQKKFTEAGFQFRFQDLRNTFQQLLNSKTS